METRIGLVDISEGVLEAYPDFLENQLSDCEVLEVRDSMETYGRRTYKLRCPEFDELQVGDKIPQYVFNFESRYGGDFVRTVEKI